MAILLLAVLLRLLLTPSATSQHSISLLTHHNHQHSTHHSNGNNIHGKQKLLTHENSLIASKAYERLTRSIDAYANGTELWGSTVFYDVVPSLKVPDSFVHPSDGKGEHSKYFIGVNALKKLGNYFYTQVLIKYLARKEMTDIIAIFN